jgi:hypothetical protein
MTATQQFIEDAIKGGWRPITVATETTVFADGDKYIIRFDDSCALLDPLAWQAVGKTRGWDEEDPECERICQLEGNCHIKNWHAFIDRLADGKTIEEALSN